MEGLQARQILLEGQHRRIKQCRRFQAIKKPMKRGTSLDLLFSTKELIRNVKIKGSTGCCDYERGEFRAPHEVQWREAQSSAPKGDQLTHQCMLGSTQLEWNLTEEVPCATTQRQWTPTETWVSLHTSGNTLALWGELSTGASCSEKLETSALNVLKSSGNGHGLLALDDPASSLEVQPQPFCDSHLKDYVALSIGLDVHTRSTSSVFEHKAVTLPWCLHIYQNQNQSSTVLELNWVPTVSLDRCVPPSLIEAFWRVEWLRHVCKCSTRVWAELECWSSDFLSRVML